VTRLRNIPAWVENGRLKEVDGDVLGIVQRVKAISPRLDVWYDDWDDGFTITETALDGTIHLVFRAPALDQRVIDRLLAADHWRGREDPEHVLPDNEDIAAKVDQFNELVQREIDAQDRDTRLEVLERFGNAMEMDGQGVKASILIKRHYNMRKSDASDGLR
jgi:hypothetical protein